MAPLGLSWGISGLVFFNSDELRKWQFWYQNYIIFLINVVIVSKILTLGKKSATGGTWSKICFENTQSCFHFWRGNGSQVDLLEITSDNGELTLATSSSEEINLFRVRKFYFSFAHSDKYKYGYGRCANTHILSDKYSYLSWRTLAGLDRRRTQLRRPLELKAGAGRGNVSDSLNLFFFKV